MTAAVLLSGWLVAGAALVALARMGARLRLVGDAAHELRGAAAALALASASMRREQGGLRRARAFESELDRMRAGLDDLDAARTGTRAPVSRSLLPLERALRTAAAGWRPVAGGQGRRVSLRWEAGTAAVRADRRRLAQVLGNLLANAIANQHIGLARRGDLTEAARANRDEGAHGCTVGALPGLNRTSLPRRPPTPERGRCFGLTRGCNRAWISGPKSARQG